ncbi:hypothetical protein CLV35_3057 [Motilibacter peucedani]|uniref:Uncharacterized protein n=1 Tax=Motilibacter peucedani TaxID=598650 RepID=A0A420XNF1_9ACTN|nr:hypothetical protein CLV35_3057 [Motilibacter peucedani]
MDPHPALHRTFLVAECNASDLIDFYNQYSRLELPQVGPSLVVPVGRIEGGVTVMDGQPRAGQCTVDVDVSGPR